jgi:hypothetical protein
LLFFDELIVHLVGELDVGEFKLPEDCEDASVEVAPVLILLPLLKVNHLIKVLVRIPLVLYRCRNIIKIYTILKATVKYIRIIGRQHLKFLRIHFL